MKYMYVNFKSHIRESFIADDNVIEHDYTDITQENTSQTSSDITKALADKSDIKTLNNCSSHDQNLIISIEPYLKAKEKTINEEITQFFFDSIHKNYLKNRM